MPQWLAVVRTRQDCRRERPWLDETANIRHDQVCVYDSVATILCMHATCSSHLRVHVAGIGTLSLRSSSKMQHEGQACFVQTAWR